MPELRLGRIDYVNADPFFAETPPPAGVEVVAAKPTALNRALVAGELDASWISSVELLRHQDLLALCPPYCIAAPGKVRSVVLVSPLPFEELEGQRLWLSTHSATSVALLRTLLAEAGVEVETARYDHQGPLPEGPVLLIGDEALRLDAGVPAAQVVDLGGRWRETTGLPMVFAVLAVRRDVLARPGLAAALRRAISWMGENRRAFEADPVGSRAFQERRAGLDEAAYLRYFSGFDFDWGPETQAGFRAFGARTRRLGLVPPGDEPAVYDPDRGGLLEAAPDQGLAG